MRTDDEGVFSSPGVFEPERDALESCGVVVDSSPVSSLSSPKDSLLFARGFFFFFLGGPSLRGVDDLSRSDQLRIPEDGGAALVLTRQSRRL